MVSTTETKLWISKTMFLSRHLEAVIKKIYLEGKTPAFNVANGPTLGEMHLSKGQEPRADGGVRPFNLGRCGNCNTQATLSGDSQGC